MQKGTSLDSGATPHEREAIESACANETPILDPTLSLEFLRALPQGKGNPHIVIGHYNLTQGLLAGYQPDTGKRILFRAMFSSNGRIAAEVLHLDLETRKIRRAAGPSARTDPITKKQVKENGTRGYRRNANEFLCNWARRKDLPQS